MGRWGALTGGSPAASYFLLLRQKKVTKEKATLLIPETPEIASAGRAAKVFELRPQKTN